MDIYNRAPPERANMGWIKDVTDTKRDASIWLSRNRTHPSSGIVAQVEVIASRVDEKGLQDDRGSEVRCGTSGHAKWYMGMWYDPKLTKYDISAQLMGEGCVEDYQYLIGTAHFADEDELLYITQKVYVE